MIVLSVQTENELLKVLFFDYQSLVQKAINEKRFSERVQILRESNQQKGKLQAQMARLQKSANSVSELEDQSFELIDDNLLQAKLRTGLFFKDDLALLLEEQGDKLPAGVKKCIQSFFNQLKPEEYLLFWYIEESEWRALLSN